MLSTTESVANTSNIFSLSIKETTLCNKKLKIIVSATKDEQEIGPDQFV